jgi:hypothetical protein
MRSPAWKSLTNPARVAYWHIKLDENGRNDGELKLPYSQAADLMDRKTFAKVISMLVDRGFITITRHGGLMQHCNLYAISDAWRRWKPPQKP